GIIKLLCSLRSEFSLLGVHLVKFFKCLHVALNCTSFIELLDQRPQRSRVRMVALEVPPLCPIALFVVVTSLLRPLIEDRPSLLRAELMVNRHSDAHPIL